jgi:hypothetical protein
VVCREISTDPGCSRSLQLPAVCRAVLASASHTLKSRALRPRNMKRARHTSDAIESASPSVMAGASSCSSLHYLAAGMPTNSPTWRARQRTEPCQLADAYTAQLNLPCAGACMCAGRRRGHRAIVQCNVCVRAQCRKCFTLSSRRVQVF